MTSKYGWTCGHIAAIHGHSACLEALAIYRCNLSIADEKGCTALHLSAAHGKTSCVELLLRFGVDFNVTDMRGWSPVHHAAYHGSLRALICLKKFGASLHEPDVEGNTPAHLAAREGQLSCLQAVLLAQEDVMAALQTRNDEGDTPKTLALHYEKQDCVEYLTELEKSAKVPDFYHKHDYPAHVAAYHGSLQLLSMLIDEGHCGINDQDMWGATPAHKAAGNGHIKCLQWLLDSAADVHLRNRNGETPKDIARKFGKVDCFALLGGEEDPSADAYEEDSAVETVADELAKDRALKRVGDLLQSLEMAKAHLKQLGGVSEDDVQRENEMNEHKRVVDKLLRDMERERIRREELEMEVDRLRLKLHQAQERVTLLEETLRQEHTHSKHRGATATSKTDSALVQDVKSSRSTHTRPVPDLNRGAYVKVTRH
jgi:ankyrin repeat domain-containing protein 42